MWALLTKSELQLICCLQDGWMKMYLPMQQLLLWKKKCCWQRKRHKICYGHDKLPITVCCLLLCGRWVWWLVTLSSPTSFAFSESDGRSCEKLTPLIERYRKNNPKGKRTTLERRVERLCNKEWRLDITFGIHIAQNEHFRIARTTLYIIMKTLL